MPTATEARAVDVEGRLDDLLLPYTIDLSLRHAIRDPQLLDHIERAGIVFYARC